MEAPTVPGRKEQSARNDRSILEAARTVFVEDADAPIATVARLAGVGIGALYRRYGNKEGLVRRLCEDGLHRFIAIADAALAAPAEPFDRLAGFLEGIVVADVHSLTVHLAGSFTPTTELRDLATRAGELASQLLRQAHDAGVVRADLQDNDLAMIFEQLAAVRLGDAERTVALRRRYLALHLESLRSLVNRSTLPGSPPSDTELGRRWVPR